MARNAFDIEALLETACDQVVQDRFIARVHRNGVMSILYEHDIDAVGALATSLSDKDIDHLLSQRARAARSLNALSLCIHSAVMSQAGFDPGTTLVSAQNLLLLKYVDPDKLISATGSSALASAELVQDPVRDRVIPEVALQLALSTFDSVASAGATAVDLVALLNESLCAYKQYNLAVSVVMAWSVCERLLKAPRPNPDALPPAETELGGETARRHIPQSASKIIGQLHASGVLDVELYGELERARVARNDWVHGEESPSRSKARTCILAALAVFQLIHGLTLPVSTDLTVV
jgi:hypothetical protein